MRTLHEWLREDHRRLERLFQELENAVECANDPTIRATWTEFERGVTTHLETEERELFPALQERHPEEIARLQRDHDRIRKLILDLGIAADLHTLRKDVADELVGALREHAAREDQTLYPWAQAEVDSAAHRSIIDKLEAALRRHPHEPAQAETPVGRP